MFYVNTGLEQRGLIEERGGGGGAGGGGVWHRPGKQVACASEFWSLVSPLGGSP